MNSLRRISLAMAAAMLALGGTMHAVAYLKHIKESIDASNLSPGMASQFKLLWLADSSTLFVVGLIAGFLALTNTPRSPIVVLLIALVPGATTILLFMFVGNFYASYLLLAATAMIVLAAYLPATSQAERPRSDVLGASHSEQKRLEECP